MTDRTCEACKKFKEDMWCAECRYEPWSSADVRENITAHKVIGGGEHKGATCWFECSRCGKTVDVNDKYCSKCGARFEA